MSTFLDSQPGRTEYPYAHSYMRKSDNYCEESVEADLQCISRFVKEPAMKYGPTRNQEVWTSIITGVDAIPEIIYWEATIVTDPDHCPEFLIYFYKRSSKFASVDARGEAGTTFGWGIIDHSTIFVTRNGKIDSWHVIYDDVAFPKALLSIAISLYGNCKSVSKEHMVADSDDSAVSDSDDSAVSDSDDGNVPHAMCNHDHNINDVLNANFGQRPFFFDIDGYVNRVHRLTRTLPLEIIDEIARWVFTRLINGIKEYRAVYPLTRVSHRWLDLCRQVSFAASSINSHAEFQAALHLGSLTRSVVFTCREGFRKPWLRSFFASSSPRHLTKVIHWTCDFDYYGIATLNFGPPADISFCIRSHSLTNISRLDMHNRRFKKWSQFAHLVFSLPQLEHLGAHDISWEDATSIENPPSWLRFTRRLRALHYNSRFPHITAGFLGLFFVGKRYRERSSEPAMDARDVPLLARIIELVLYMIDDCGRVVYTNDNNTTCCVTAFNSNKPWLLKLYLRVKPEDNNYQNLVDITINGCIELPLLHVTEIERLSRRLSNHDTLAANLPLQLDCNRHASYAVSYTRHTQGVFSLPESTEIDAESHPGMVQSHAGYHSFSDFSSEVLDYLPGIVVPQQTYPAPSGFAPFPPVQFYHHGQPGVHLGGFYDATDSYKYDRAAVRPLSVLQIGSAPMLNILWPGCYTVWCTALPEVPQNGCLVGIIAWAVRCIYRDMTSNGVATSTRDPSHSDWASSKCPFEKLYLMELRHVSPAGWQPVFCLDCNVSQ